MSLMCSSWGAETITLGSRGSCPRLVPRLVDLQLRSFCSQELVGPASGTRSLTNSAEPGTVML